MREIIEKRAADAKEALRWAERAVCSLCSDTDPDQEAPGYLRELLFDVVQDREAESLFLPLVLFEKRPLIDHEHLPDPPERPNKGKGKGEDKGDRDRRDDHHRRRERSRDRDRRDRSRSRSRSRRRDRDKAAERVGLEGGARGLLEA